MLIEIHYQHYLVFIVLFSIPVYYYIYPQIYYINYRLKSIKILHIITSLSNGGAEGALFRLCKYNPSSHYIVCLTGKGKYTYLLKKIGINVVHLNFDKKNFFSFLNIFKVFRIILDYKPNLVQSWMYHSDLTTVIIKLLPNINIFWGLRHSDVQFGKTTTSTFYIIKLLSKLSYIIPKKIISCSLDGIKVHASIGYSLSKMVYIPNGYIVSHQKYSKSEVFKFKSRIGTSPYRNSLAMVARFDPQKDHFTLLYSFANLLKNMPDTCLILAGRGMNNKNAFVNNLVQMLNIKDQVFLIDEIDNVSLLFNSVDVSVLSSSFGEGFPNVVAESMLCSTPCVVTNIGDAPVIVGDLGWVVPPSSPDLLSLSIQEALIEKNDCPINWKNRCLQSHNYIKKNFSIQTTSLKFDKCWHDGIFKI